MEVTELKRELRLEKTINEHLRLKVTKLQESLDETKRQLSELQERVRLSEQVTAATQQRELQGEGIYEKLIAENREDHVYEKLLKDFNQLAAHKGRLILSLTCSNI